MQGVPEKRGGVGCVADPVALVVEEGGGLFEDLGVGLGFAEVGGEGGCVGVDLSVVCVSWWVVVVSRGGLGERQLTMVIGGSVLMDCRVQFSLMQLLTSLLPNQDQ